MINKANPLRIYWDIRDLPDRGITGIQHHLLYFLQSCMNTNNECWYGVEQIAYKARWSESATRRNLNILNEKGYIIKRTGGKGAKDTNVYSINFNLLSKDKGRSETPFLVDRLSTRVASEITRVAHNPNKGSLGTPEDINKDIKEVFTQRNRSRGEKALLPDNFQPNDKHLIYAKSREIDLWERMLQFKASCKAQRKKSYDWNEEFMAYLLGSFKKKNAGSKKEYH